jgi:hypothetical protein
LDTRNSFTNNPLGEADVFKFECPSTQPAEDGGQGCRYAVEDTSLPLNVLTAASTNIYITGVDTDLTKSRLLFDQNIQGVLHKGDHLTIDVNTALNHGKLLGEMNLTEKYDAYKLSGYTPFQDDPSKTYMVAHKLDEVADIGGMVDTHKMTIPYGWTSNGGPKFSFVNDQGHWTRHNKIETPLTIKGAVPKSDMTVCWGVTQGLTYYYANAGTVSFEAAPEMKSSRINLSTLKREQVAPLILSFTTEPSGTDFARLTKKNAEQLLMIRFLDLSEVTGKLVPRYAGDTPPNTVLDKTQGPEIIDDTLEILVKDKGQWVCGRLFNELWSDHPEGFPMPSGCYFGKKFRDTQEKGFITTFYREFYMSFPPGSGLRSNVSYQIALNAYARDMKAGSNLVDIFAMCDGMACDRPYQVIEKGTAIASYGDEPGATFVDPSFAGSQGLTLQHAVDETVHLGGESTLTQQPLQFKLRGNQETAAIQKNNFLRVYLWPLTAWKVEDECQAMCTPWHEDIKTKCGTITECTYEEVAYQSGRKNVIKLKLPVEMYSINNQVQHTITVQKLGIPLSGFFASRIGAQVTNTVDAKPSYTTSDQFIFSKSSPRFTTGRLVLAGRTGQGTKPFAGEAANILYLRLQFGATLWNNGEQNAASIHITLPPGYTCSVPGTGYPDVSLPLYSLDLDKDGNYDNARGYLSVATEDGNWINSKDRQCVYTLQQHMRVYAGTVYYVEVTVDNPKYPLQKVNTTNVWTIDLAGKGSDMRTDKHVVPINMTDYDFISMKDATELGEDYWAGNVAVLNILLHETLQPTNFVQGVMQHIHVFFKTSTKVGRNGSVVLDAPDGYEFGEQCNATDLPEPYYVYLGPGRDQVLKMKTMRGCFGTKYPVDATTFNRARTWVGGVIFADTYYGYRIKVAHPLKFNSEQPRHWYLWTLDKYRYTLEGTQSTVNGSNVLFNLNTPFSDGSFYNKGYGIYKDPLDENIKIEVQGLQPYSITNEFSDVYVYPISFPVYMDTSLRITAPYGYEWAVEAGNDFWTRTLNMTTSNWPSVPDVLNKNQLVWPKIEFANEQTYGFMAKIKVPDFAPVTSTNAFYFEYGYDKTLFEPVSVARLQAGIIPAPSIAAIKNAAVSYGSNLVDYQDNKLEFRFETVTQLWTDEGVVIEGNANTIGFYFSCPPETLDDSPKFPQDLKCITRVTTDNELPQIFLKADEEAIPPGYYKFEMRVLNPTNLIQTPGTWTIGSFRAVSNFNTFAIPNTPILDNPMVAPGFRINGMLLDARLPTLTEQQLLSSGRDDRPSAKNQLIFRFQLRTTPGPGENILELRGPRGFIFEDDCLPFLFTSVQDVFGPNSADIYPPLVTQWNEEWAPTQCTGDGRFATITIPSGLVTINYYIFRIGVTNPITTPVWNKWTIDYSFQTSDPFEGFKIWTFEGTSLTPVSFARTPELATPSQRIVNPVAINFQPFKTVPPKCAGCSTGGMLQVTAQPGFEFVVVGPGPNECKATLYVMAIGILKSSFPESTLKCTIIKASSTGGRRLSLGTGNGDRLQLEIIGGETGVEGGTVYTLIVDVYNPGVGVETLGPPQDWYFNTFDLKPTAFHQLLGLDEIMIPGPAINNVLSNWTVVNAYNRLNGMARVQLVEMTMAFPDQLEFNDRILINSPINFDIRGNPESASCNTYQWPQVSPLAEATPPKCVCQGRAETNGITCDMEWTITQEIVNMLIGSPPSMNIHFSIATENPSKTPDDVVNYWLIKHYRGTDILSSASYRSWDINPQLESVVIALPEDEGAYPYRAGSVSSLHFTFTPVMDASMLRIEALEPTGFDFDNAQIDLPYTINSNSAKNLLIINTDNRIIGGQSPQRMTIVVNKVTLGMEGGQTKWSLTTYVDGEDKMMTANDKRDEKVNYTLPGAFRLPGEILIASKQLVSNYQLYSDVNPQNAVRSLFPPRVDETAVAEFVVTFSRPIMAQEKLAIMSVGSNPYELLMRTTDGDGTCEDTVTIIGKEKLCTRVDADERVSPYELITALEPREPSTVTALTPYFAYTINIAVVPKGDTNSPNWVIITDDGTEYPTNTNDGLTPGFNPVGWLYPIVLNVMQPLRTDGGAPPRALITLKISAQQNTMKYIKELIVIAPPSFTFPADGICGADCVVGEAFGSTMRRTAIIREPTNTFLTQPGNDGLFMEFGILCFMPEIMPDGAQPWFLEGRSEIGGSPVAWGESRPEDSVVVAQMPAAVSYASVGSLRGGQLSFWFTMLEAGGTEISVEAPTHYALTCSKPPTSLKQGNLPGDRPGCNDHPLVLSLTATMQVLTYNFAVAVDLPSLAPTPNTFNLIVRDRNQEVVDAAYGLSGVNLLPLPIDSPQLSWSNAAAGQTSTITISCQFWGDYNLNDKIKNYPRIRAILFTIPSQFRTAVKRQSQVVNDNANWPVALSQRDGYVEINQTNVRIDMEPNFMVIPAGYYSWSFPVTVPSPHMPSINVWYMSLCSDKACKQTVTPGTVSVNSSWQYTIVSFPMQGFNVSELSEASVRAEAAGAQPRSSRSGLSVVTVLVAVYFARSLMNA